MLERFECSPGHKYHRNHSNVCQYVYANEEELCGVETERQTPKRGKQNRGKIFDIDRGITHRVDIGINYAPTFLPN